MSGHSKWHNIAKRKGANDAKKAKIFTKIGREMAIAIKEGGSANPDFNARLRDCIAKAKANNMPNDNIKRTLDKYSGANGQVNYEANNYEGYGVGGVAVVVETLTDNKNRTVADVRHLFDKYGAGLGATNCVSWQFDKKGVIIMERGELDEDTVMMQALEAGAEDFQADEETFEIYTTPDDFSAVREALDNTPTTLEQGNVGAGTGATVGKLMGPATCMKAGLGAAAVALGPVKVGAVVSVNACGNVVDPFTGEWVAGMRAAADSDQIVDMELAAFAAAGSMQMPLDRTNTTISCIVTNVELTKAQATKVSQMAADAYAHAIRPTHTTNDGDTIYTLASGKLGAQASAAVPLDLLGMLAVRALQTAIVNGAKNAKTSHGIPGAAK